MFYKRMVLARFSVKKQNIDSELRKMIGGKINREFHDYEKNDHKKAKRYNKLIKLQTEVFKEGIKIEEKLIEWVVPTEMLN